MADVKFSDMTAATEWNEADYVAGIQGGDNKTVTKEIFLTSGAGEAITLWASGLNQARLADDDEEAIVLVDDNTKFITLVATNGDIVISCNDSGAADQIHFTFGVGSEWQLGTNHTFAFLMQGGGGSFVLSNISNSLQVTGYASVQIQCDVLSSTPWSGNPTYYSDAIQRLANAVAGLLGGTIP